MAALLVAVAGAAAFWATGGRWFAVRTGSMGTAAPVGTLVLTRPVEGDDLRVGQVIAFHPPTAPQLTYTHRVVSVTGEGIRTRGDANGAPDGWTLQSRDVIGRSIALLPGAGWLLRALPMLLAGALVVFGLARLWVRPDHRGPFVLLGLSLVVSGVVALLKPFLGVAQMSSTTNPDGRVAMAFVSTGLLPVRISAVPGHGHATPVDLRTGQVGVVRLSGLPADGHFAVATHLHLSVMGWIGIATVWCVPLVWSILAGRRRSARTRGAAVVPAVAS